MSADRVLSDAISLLDALRRGHQPDAEELENQLEALRAERAAARETDRQLRELLDRYQGKFEARLAEDSGGRFDIALSVGEFDIACLNLRATEPLQLFRDTREGPLAMAQDGSLVPLP